MEPGNVIAERYRLLRLLDVGGMGEVWAAKNELTQKSFAIKFLLPELAERPDALERFIREAETAGSLNHRAIVNVFDVAQAEDGRPFIVMELLAGESVEARVERTGPLTSLETAAFISQVADGLEAAHRADIVHRDLSSSNIFLSRNPDGGTAIAKILDFGVSKTLGPARHDRTQTGNGAVLGCPEFMSPEQARGAEAVDARTDVWSLGIVMYQCLAGKVPFRAQNYNALMVAILTRPHRPIVEVTPSVDRELAEIVESCLSKDREQRVQSAREVADRLSSIVRRLAGSSSLPTAPQRRATDRLPARRDESKTSSALLGKEDLQALERLRARRRMIGLISAGIGCFAGLVVALVVGARGHDEVSYVSIPATPIPGYDKRSTEPLLPVPHEFATLTPATAVEPPPAHTDTAKATDTTKAAVDTVNVAETIKTVAETVKVAEATKTSESSLPDGESRLAIAVARGLGVGAKPVSEH
ncbi:MAG TPA: serine/threonine-protein kinase [Polyangiaceae bacterium]|nr:serine/threonine-protein kinase [Polyangiaceae bacterium]